MEVPQGVGRPVRVSPEPVDAVPEQCRDDAVGPEDLAVEHRLPGWRAVAEHLAVTVDARAGDPVDPFGDVQPLDLQSGFATGSDLQAGSPVPEPILGEFVAVAADMKKDTLVDQPRFVKGHAAGRVGVIADVVDGPQLDQRYAPSGHLVDELDLEAGWLVGCRRAGDDTPQQNWQGAKRVSGRCCHFALRCCDGLG